MSSSRRHRQLERFLDVGVNDAFRVAGHFSVGCFLPPLSWHAVLLAHSHHSVGLIRFQRLPRYAGAGHSLVDTQLSNNLSGIETIKSYTAEALPVSSLKTLKDYQSANRSAIKLSS